MWNETTQERIKRYKAESTEINNKMLTLTQTPETEQEFQILAAQQHELRGRIKELIEMELSKKHFDLTKKFLDQTDMYTATCPKCGRNFGPNEEYKLSENLKSCNRCGAQLILPSEKREAATEIVLAEITENTGDRNTRQLRAIDAAALTHGLNLSDVDDYEKAMAEATRKNPKLFDPRGKIGDYE